ncbi:MAG TPA: cytochrome c-type biogenesis protein CcmH [Granulicella sp.]
MRKLFANPWLRAATLCLVVVLVMGASSDPTARFNNIGHKMMCVCSCGQILLECNHVGCPDSARMINELRDQLTSGGTDTSIFNWFAAKYGPTVLAAPIRGGFDTVAWVVPIALFLLATIGTAFVVRAWRQRSTPAPALVAGPGNPAADALRERIRRETEY